jgi:chemotaxis protein methyltransferase CheR
MNEIEYECLKKKIQQLIKIDLNNYKGNQMIRRLDGFICRTKATDVIQYCGRLENDPAEVTKLRSFITINVSEFYRDQMHFETLRKDVLPELLKKNPKLNIWSAGCSDGEEPYSIAVMLNELTPGVKHRIFATDIDKESLSKATAGGPYLAQEIRNVPQSLLMKYFTASEEGYIVSERIRERITFTQHDLTRDKFPFGFDLIICRNVTIYFSNETKRTLSLRFLNALKENGLLFIGATETMLDANEIGFQRAYPCFYRKSASAVPVEPKILSSAILSNR